jgi:hypothetical protein
VIPESPEERVRIENGFRQQISNFACNNAATRRLLDAGYVVTWSYRLGDETEIAVAMTSNHAGISLPNKLLQATRETRAPERRR